MPSIGFDAAVAFDSPDYSFDGELVTAALTAATETDTAFDVTLTASLTLGTATESDTAFDVAVVTSVPLGTAAETDSANDVTITATLALGTAAETDTAFAVSPVEAGNVALDNALETDTAYDVTPYIARVLLDAATELDTAYSVSPSTGTIDDATDAGERVTIRGDYRITIVGTSSDTKVTVNV